MELVGERGLSEATVEEIAAAADVSTRTFFNYFASKEDAVAGWDPERVDELLAAVAAQPAELSAFDALRAALLGALASSDADSEELLKRLEVLRSDPHLFANHATHWAETERQLVDAIARRRRARGGANPGTDADDDRTSADDRYAALLVATTLSACRVAMLDWCADGGREPLHDVLAAHLRCLSEGLPEERRPI